MKARGMEDFYPEEQAIRKQLRNTCRAQAQTYGFQEVKPPVIETIRLLTAKSGEEIKQQLFTLEKRGSEELGLRFDLTVPMARMFIARQELAKPVKWFTIDKNWRYEAPQKGRLREFEQFSVELFGSSLPEADAECLNLLISCLEATGLTSKDVTVKINNRKLLEGLLLEVASQEQLPAIVRLVDKSGKITKEEFSAELKKLGLDEQKINIVTKITACKGDKTMLDKITQELKPNALATEGINELENTLSLVDNGWITIDLSVARGLAYYTGNVYEAFDKKEQYRSIAGGGRYDNLIQVLGGKQTAATGFAIGFETLTLLLKEKNALPDAHTSPEYYIAPVNAQILPKAQEIAQKLRKTTTADIDLMQRKLSKQFEYANTIGARKVVIVGEKDLKEGNVTIRDMQTGKEEQVSVEKL